MCQTIPMAELLAKNRTDPGFVAGYTEADYSVIAAMLRARIAAGLTKSASPSETATPKPPSRDWREVRYRRRPRQLWKYPKAVGKRLRVGWFEGKLSEYFEIVNGFRTACQSSNGDGYVKNTNWKQN